MIAIFGVGCAPASFGGDHAGVNKIVAQLLPLGVGANSIFARHARETFVATRADATIDENVAIQRGMDQTVASLVNAAQQGVEHGTDGLIDTLGRSRVLLLGVAFISIIAAAVVGAFYVQRRLVTRLLSVSDAMRRLAAGDVDSPLPAIQTGAKWARWRARFTCCALVNLNAGSSSSVSAPNRWPSASALPRSIGSSTIFAAP
jgi:hypothetical protein